MDRPLTRLVEELARLKSSPARGRDLAIETTGQLTLHLITNHHAPLRAMFNDDAREQLESAHDLIGEPLLFTGTVVECDVHADDPAERRWIVRIENTQTHVMVTRAQVMWKSDAGTVFVGGVIAGEIDGPDGMPVTIVERGFIVSPE